MQVTAQLVHKSKVCFRAMWTHDAETELLADAFNTYVRYLWKHETALGWRSDSKLRTLHAAVWTSTTVRRKTNAIETFIDYVELKYSVR